MMKQMRTMLAAMLAGAVICVSVLSPVGTVYGQEEQQDEWNLSEDYVSPDMEETTDPLPEETELNEMEAADDPDLQTPQDSDSGNEAGQDGSSYENTGSEQLGKADYAGEFNMEESSSEDCPPEESDPEQNGYASEMTDPEDASPELSDLEEAVSSSEEEDSMPADEVAAGTDLA